MSEQRMIQLEDQLDHLVKVRKQIIEEAERTITETNKWFDKQALPIHRELNRLREAAKPADKPVVKRAAKPVKTTMDFDPEWSDEDIAHYRKLMGS